MGIRSSNETKEEENRIPPKHIFSPVEGSILDQLPEDEEGWSQEIPDFNTLSDPTGTRSSKHKNKYPLELPAHLERALLNSQPVSEDPGMLPLPHHVMLNHLYARPSSYNTVILGLTVRYKENFVTLVHYKPVKRKQKYKSKGFEIENIESNKQGVPIPTQNIIGEK